MTRVELVADSDVVSYMYGRGPLGKAYWEVIGERRTGITLLAVAESRVGGLRVLTVHQQWEVREETSSVYVGRMWLDESDAEYRYAHASQPCRTHLKR